MLEEKYAKGKGAVLFGFIINIILTVFKFWAGVIGKSQVMIADAVHSFSDLTTDIIVLIGLKFSCKPKDKVHPYGHGKIETVATGIVGLGLIIVGLEIGYEGIHASIFHPKTVPTFIALVAAVVSIAVKEGLYRYTVFVGKKIGSQSVIANAWHHRSDAFSSVAALAGIAGSQMGWVILDPLAAALVAVMIVKVGIEIGLASFKELIESSVDEKMIRAISEKALTVQDVREVHAIKARNVGTSIFVELHIEVDENMTVKESHTVAGEVENVLKADMADIESVTVHVEPAKSSKEYPRES